MVAVWVPPDAPPDQNRAARRQGSRPFLHGCFVIHHVLHHIEAQNYVYRAIRDIDALGILDQCELHVQSHTGGLGGRPGDPERNYVDSQYAPRAVLLGRKTELAAAAAEIQDSLPLDLVPMEMAGELVHQCLVPPPVIFIRRKCGGPMRTVGLAAAGVGSHGKAEHRLLDDSVDHEFSSPQEGRPPSLKGCRSFGQVITIVDLQGIGSTFLSDHGLGDCGVTTSMRSTARSPFATSRASIPSVPVSKPSFRSTA